MKSDRIQYIDYAKGILILLLLYGHSVVYCRMDGLNDRVLLRIGQTMPLYNCFFMQSFFIITGFCTNFNIEFKEFLRKNIVHLLLPAVILCLVSYLYRIFLLNPTDSFAPIDYMIGWTGKGAPWFIISMFWAKLIGWGALRLRTAPCILVVVVLYMLGLLLSRIDVYNIQYHQHAFMMLPYLLVGVVWRRHQVCVDRTLGCIAFAGAVAIVSVNVMAHFGIFRVPTHDLFINVSLRTFPIHMITALGGTALVLWIARRIKSSAILLALGYGSILCYLWNGLVYRTIVRLMMPLYPAMNSPLRLLLFHFGAYLICVAVFYCLIRAIYGTKYLSWMVGRYSSWVINERKASL